MSSLPSNLPSSLTAEIINANIETIDRWELLPSADQLAVFSRGVFERWLLYVAPEIDVKPCYDMNQLDNIVDRAWEGVPTQNSGSQPASFSRRSSILYLPWHDLMETRTFDATSHPEAVHEHGETDETDTVRGFHHIELVVLPDQAVLEQINKPDKSLKITNRGLKRALMLQQWRR